MCFKRPHPFFTSAYIPKFHTKGKKIKQTKKEGIFMDEKIREYQKKVTEVLQRDYFPKEEGWVIEPHTVRKNNDVKLSAIAIRQNKDGKVAPTMYVNGYYEEGYTEEAAAHNIYEVYQHSKAERKRFENADRNSILEFKNIKDKICYKLVNAQMNQKAADKAPHLPVTKDLMMTFYIQIQKNAAINIDNRLLDIWGLDKEKAAEQLYFLAEENVQRLHPVSIKSMEEMLREFMAEDMMESIDEVGDVPPLYILTNDDNLNGAAVLFYGKGKVMQDCLEKMQNDFTGISVKGFYMLPSSVQECILLPEMEGMDMNVNELREMVRTINQSEVAADKVLSDNVFHYDKVDGFKQLTFSSREISR